MGELAQLSGRPYLVVEQALTDVEAVAIPPDRLRAMLIAEADLGERIMRALILRRVGLIETGAGPVVIGQESDAEVLRLTNFLRRNGHPYRTLDPASDSCAQTLVARFKVEPEELPIVLCPTGQLLRSREYNPLLVAFVALLLASAIGWVGLVLAPAQPGRPRFMRFEDYPFAIDRRLRRAATSARIEHSAS
jgi:hypothetical protein